MVQVTIDVGALRGVVSSMTTLVSAADSQRSTVTTRAQAALTSAPSLDSVGTTTATLTTLADELSDRIDLAVLVNGGDPGFAGTVSYDVRSDTATDTREQIGVQMAELGLDLESPPQTEEEFRQYQWWAQMMGKHQEDPTVTSSMFSELGPDGTYGILYRYQQMQDAYPQMTPLEWTDEGGWLEGTTLHEWVDGIQDQLMTTYSAALATATNSGGLPDDFGTQLADAAAEDGYMAPWMLGAMLREGGEFDNVFLDQVATSLYEFEKDSGDSMIWSQMNNGDLPEWGSGAHTNEYYYADPFNGLLVAMQKNPQSVLDFFAEPGAESTARMDYFVDKRDWGYEGMDALAAALDAGATSFREPGTDQAYRAAWLASTFVMELGDNGGVEENARDSVGHILATYIADVDRVANGFDASAVTPYGNGVVEYGDNPSAPWFVGLPTGAAFSYADLNAVMSDVMKDDGAIEQVGQASAAWNAHRLHTSVENVNDLDDQIAEATADGNTQLVAQLQEQREEAVGHLVQASNSQGGLNGYVLGNIDVAAEEEGKSKDDQAKKYIGLASDVIGLVPTGGTFTSFLADQALNQGKDWIEGSLTGNEAAAEALNLNTQQASISTSQMATFTALADAGLIPEPNMTNANGDRHPWFDAEGNFLVDEASANPALFWDYINSDTGRDAAFVDTSLTEAYTSAFRRGGGD